MGRVEKELTFYKIMNYPVPTQKEIFYFEKKVDKVNLNNEFSWEEKNEFMDSFIKKINKYGKLYRSLPFVSEIFLCNSISFNSLKGDSDIDIFIISKKNSIRRSRFFSALFFKVLGLKRSQKNKKQKFCLSFYITEDHKNLYPIMLKKTDIYLIYRLAHLTPLYQESKNLENIFFKNKWLQEALPNHPQDYCINLGNNLFTGKSKLKKIIEFLFSGIFGIFFENLIKIFRKPILNFKIKKLGNKGQHIIVNDNMLKFHNDIREQIHSIYKIAQK